MRKFETLLCDVAGRVATVTLNRPTRLNAYTVEMGWELFTLLHELDLDDEVRAIVVTGAGRAFCAGADLDTGAATFGAARRYDATREAESKVTPWNMRTPVIAAINGHAVGIGATLPLWWDLRLAAETAKIGFVFTRRGIIPEAYSTWILPRLIGAARAFDVLLTGRMLSAREALELGIVSRVTAPDALLPAALEVAHDIANNTAPVSVAVTKRLLWRQLLVTDPLAAKALEDELFYFCGRAPDAAEGIESFLEKRPPEWRMRASEDLPPGLEDLTRVGPGDSGPESPGG